MITAQAVFNNMTKELGRYPTLDEFKSRGYSKTAYYRAKREYKGE